MHLNLNVLFRYLLLALSLAFPFSLLRSQKATEGQPVTTLKVRTSLVSIPAIVTDKQGKPIEDLTKDDFIVKEDGKPQTIAFFEHVKTSLPRPIKPAIPQGVFTNLVNQDQPTRLTIIVIDARTTRVSEQLETRKRIVDFVAKNVSLDQPVALMMFGSKGLSVLHDFTTDPKVLVAALKNVQNGKSMVDAITADVNASHDRSDPRLNAGERWTAGQIAFETDQINLAFQDFSLLQTKSMVSQTLGQFEQIAKAFAGVPGRKSLIWITNGESLDLGDAQNAASMTPPTAPKFTIPGYAPVTGGAPMLTANVAPEMASVFERVWRAMNAANIAVYPLDVSNLASPAYVDPSSRLRAPMAPPVSPLVKMEEMAERTGGTICDHNIALDECFERASHDSEDYYLLAYYMDSSNKKKEWRKLDILVPRREVRIRARSGYMPQAKPAEGDKQIAEEMLAAMGSPLEYTTLLLQVKIRSIGSSDKDSSDKSAKKKVTFSFALPPGGDFVTQGTNTVDLQFGALATLPDGKPAGQFSRRIAGDLKPEVASQIGVQGLLLDGTIDLAPGEYQIRFVARDNQTGKIGSITAPVKVEAKNN